MNSIVDELRPIVPLLTGAVETQEHRRAKHEVLSDTVDYILSLETKLAQHAMKVDALERRVRSQEAQIKEAQIREVSRAAESTVKTMQEAAVHAGVRIKCHCHAEPLEGEIGDGIAHGNVMDDEAAAAVYTGDELNGVMAPDGVDEEKASVEAETKAALKPTATALVADKRGAGTWVSRDDVRVETNTSTQATTTAPTGVVFEFEEVSNIAAPAVRFTVDETTRKTMMNIKCADRRGLLSDIMKVTARLPLTVLSARILTLPGGMVDDNFEVLISKPMSFDALEKEFITMYADVTASASLLGDKRARPTSPR